MEVPTGLTEVNLGNREGVWWEDVACSKSKEIWLVQVPQNFDVSSLNNGEAIINGILPLPNSETAGKSYSASVELCDSKVNDDLVVLLPSKEKNKWLPVKPVSKQMCVFREINIPPVHIVENNTAGSLPDLVMSERRTAVEIEDKKVSCTYKSMKKRMKLRQQQAEFEASSKKRKH